MCGNVWMSSDSAVQPYFVFEKRQGPKKWTRTEVSRALRVVGWVLILMFQLCLTGKMRSPKIDTGKK